MLLRIATAALASACDRQHLHLPGLDLLRHRRSELRNLHRRMRRDPRLRFLHRATNLRRRRSNRHLRLRLPDDLRRQMRHRHHRMRHPARMRQHLRRLPDLLGQCLHHGNQRNELQPERLHTGRYLRRWRLLRRFRKSSARTTAPIAAIAMNAIPPSVASERQPMKAAPAPTICALLASAAPESAKTTTSSARPASNARQACAYRAATAPPAATAFIA